jgi:glyoxylase-like metal-dependent hydrolase (beta-lactamase superfamily II)
MHNSQLTGKLAARRRAAHRLHNPPGARSAPAVAMPRWIAAVPLLALSLPAPAPALEAVPVADGVYAFIGALDEASPANGGNTGNAGFIVGPDGVVVVDTGASYRQGRAILEAIAAVSNRPVRLAILTHGVQETVFGAAAFAERGIPLLAHRETVALMRNRCEHCLANLVALLGEDAMRGTRLVLPERSVEGPTTLQVAGLQLELLHFGWAATPGDLAVLHRASGALFAGALVSAGRVPLLRDGKLGQWRAALDALAQVPSRVLVPAHGAVSTPLAIAATGDYLRALDDKARELFQSGRSLLEAVDEGELPAYAGWAGYPALHRKNIHQRYLEYELEELERP